MIRLPGMELKNPSEHISMEPREMQDVDKKIIEVTPEAWQALKVTAAMEGRPMYELASEVLIDALRQRAEGGTSQESSPSPVQPCGHAD